MKSMESVEQYLIKVTEELKKPKNVGVAIIGSYSRKGKPRTEIK